MSVNQTSGIPVTAADDDEVDLAGPTDDVDTVESLVETLENGRLGFEQAANALADDDHPVLADRLRTYAEQRKEFSAELRRVAHEQGVAIDLDASGTVPGQLHRSWIGLKDAVTGNDAEAILDAVVSGEDHALSTFEDALEDLDGPVADTARAQSERIGAAREEIRGFTLV